MKKVDCFKNSGINVMADNAGEKKILDGCKFCMEKRGCKCDKAEEMFNQPSILSPHLPDDCVKYSALVSEKPLDFPLQCYEYGPAFLRYCENCQVVYETRYYIDRVLNETCPHCGKLGIPVSDLYQDAYGLYLEKDYYYTGFYPPCPYEKGLGCTDAYTENCGKDCFYHPFYIHCSESEEAYDILAGYYDEYDDFGGLKAWEVGEILEQMALERELSMCYDELGGYFSEDEDMCYRDDEEEYWHFMCYEELYFEHMGYWFDEYDLESYYRSLTFDNITMSTRETMEALDFVESIFCGVEHPTNEDEFEKDIEFFRNYKFECKKTSTSWLTCAHKDKCLYHLFWMSRTETVLKEIEKRVSYIKEHLQEKKAHLRDFYLELLEITLILHYASYDRLGEFVELVRGVCMRREKCEADDCFGIVLGLLDTVKALSNLYKD